MHPAAQTLDAALTGNKHFAVLAADDNSGSLGHALSAALQADGETLHQAAAALNQVQLAYPSGSRLALHVPAGGQPPPPPPPLPVAVAEVAKAAPAPSPAPEPPKPTQDAVPDQHIRLIEGTLAQHRLPSSRTGAPRTSKPLLRWLPPS